MIVPVWLATTDSPTKEVLTYAMLDNQSDCTFILEDLASSISSKCTPTKLKLSTMSAESSLIDTAVVPNLMVRGMNQDTRVKIPSAYKTKQIPAQL